jgi:hypothetical protein
MLLIFSMAGNQQKLFFNLSVDKMTIYIRAFTSIKLLLSDDRR